MYAIDACLRAGHTRPRWRLADLRAVVPWLRDDRLSGISKVLTRLGVRRTHGRFALHGPDPDYQPKLAAIDQAVARARAAPERVRVRYAHERPLVRQPSLGLVSAPRGPGPTVPRTTEPGRSICSPGRSGGSGRGRWGWTGSCASCAGCGPPLPPGALSGLGHLAGAPASGGAGGGGRAGLRDRVAADRCTLDPPDRDAVVLSHAGRGGGHRLAAQGGQLTGQVAAFLDQFADGSEVLLRDVGLLPD